MTRLLHAAYATGLAVALLILLIIPLAAQTPGNKVMVVKNAEELRASLREAEAGTTLRLGAADYGNGFHFKGLWGTKERPIVIAAAKAGERPRFSGGTQAMQFSNCRHVVLRDLHVKACSINGINADDGGNVGAKSVGMVFENLLIEDIGPEGNRDGLKLSGLDQFTVRKCRFRGWGGSAIDMVGCHDGTIEGCHFEGRDGFSQSNGVQAKGGSEKVVIRQCEFRDAGQRGVNIGGSTGLPYFRPKGCDYEARAIEVVGNTFFGSLSPVAFVSSIDCRVRQNTMVHPDKWVLRILQEQTADTFQPCQRGVFEKNLILFDRRVRTFVNIGPNTKPKTFTMRGNAWVCTDGDRRPNLPIPETNGIHDLDPKLDAKGKPQSTDPRLKHVGAQSSLHK